MGDSTSPSDVFNELAHEFAERLRQGERPSLTEYTDLYPELADEIRDLFPTLAMMEQLGSGDDHLSDRTTHRLLHGQSPPERLGDYRILREIGRGGMGIVYEAEQESLGRHVALKVLTHHRHLGRIQLIRFQREARAAALLHHTNIVPVFGVGVHEGVHYYAMQYIQGRSLDAVLREVIRLRGNADADGTTPPVEPGNISASLAHGLLMNQFWAPPADADGTAVDLSPAGSPGGSAPPTWPLTDAERTPAVGSSSSLSILGRKESRYYRSVARLGMEAAEALAHAHAHGVIHRDIKPANLLLDLQGTIWVTDFGLAKPEGAEELTSPGDVVGTLRYMAPERFQGKADQRCDIYSLGLSLYEMLTLKPAFPASHRPQLINAILDIEPPRPRKVDPQIRRDLETIVLKAIAKNPSDRFASASELARELGRFVQGRPIQSRRASVPERLWRWSRRNPAVALLTLLAATLTTVLAIGSTTAAWKFREQRDVVRKEQENTQAELGRSLLLQARALRYSRQPGRRAEGLQTLAKAARIAREGFAPADHLEELRDEVIATLAEVDEQPGQTWPGLNPESESVSFSIVGDRYVVLEGNRSFHVHRLSDRAEIRVVSCERSPAVRLPKMVPGGRFVIVRTGVSQTELWDLERGEVPAHWPADVRCAAYRPDGKQVAALRSDGELRVYDLPAMTEAARGNLGLEVPRRIPMDRMALSQDGRCVALMRADTRDAGVYEVTSGRVLLELKTPLWRVHSTVALSRNGGLLAITHDRAISVYDVANGEQLAVLQGHQSEGINARFEPEGTLLASSSWDGKARLWDPIRGRLLLTLEGNFQTWVGSGSQIAISRGKDLILYQIARGMERRTIDCRMLSEQAGAALYGPARVVFSSDGQMIAMALRPEGVRIVRASDGKGLARLPIGDCDEVLFLPDGSLLTCNDRGLCRWPVQRMTGDTLRMGPPEPLAPIIVRGGLVHTGLASSASGRLIGVSSRSQQGTLLLDPENPRRRTWLIPHRAVFDVAISPDGRWAATAGSELSRDIGLIKVWDAATGQLQLELPVGTSDVAFSPDSQWLGVNSSSRYQFFRTGSWTRMSESRFDEQLWAMRMAFHPSSRIVAAMDSSRSVVRLVAVETGRVLASLEGTDDSSLHYLVFSPDGRFLAVSHTDQRVDLWDLSSIRRELEAMNLATGLPDIFGGVSTESDGPAIERIELAGADPGGLRLLAARQTLSEAGRAARRLLDSGLADAQELHMRGQAWERLGQWRLAAADYRKSLATRPSAASTANNLAWCLASMPGRGDADEAVRWARIAVDLVPGDPNTRNTLGAALYRAGHFAEAAVELEHNIPQNNATAGYDWVFLAMCRERLGQPASARIALAHAEQWSPPGNLTDAAPPAELQVLIREAQDLLDGTHTDLPPGAVER